MIDLLPNSVKSKAPILGLLLFFSFFTSGQSVRFKEPLIESVKLQQIVQDGDYYYGMGQYYDFGVGRFGVILLKLDSLGQVVKERTFIDSSFTNFPSPHISLEKTLENNFAAVFSKEITPRVNGVLIFNQNLDTLDFHTPVNDGKQRLFYQLKQLPDSGFVISADFFVNNTSRASLIRINKTGQLLWESVYKDVDSFSIQPFHVYLAPDGGFLIAGHKFDYPDFQTADPVIIRTDSVGNLIWKKTYGGGQVDGLPSAAFRGDGRIILYYTEGTQAIQQGHRYAAVFSLIDEANGNVIAKKLYPFINHRRMLSYNLLKDGNKFIATGEFSPEGKLKGGARQGYSLAVDNNLNDIWFRNYSLHGLTAEPDDWSVLYDLRPTSDGGYISGGYAVTDDSTQLNVRLGYNGWIVKMDSMGCEVQNCVNRIGLEEKSLEDSNEDFDVFPNPSDKFFEISSETLENGKAQLFDMRGNLIEEIFIEDGNGLIPTENVAPGFYLLKITDGRNFNATKKVSIIH